MLVATRGKRVDAQREAEAGTCSDENGPNGIRMKMFGMEDFYPQFHGFCWRVCNMESEICWKPWFSDTKTESHNGTCLHRGHQHMTPSALRARTDCCCVLVRFLAPETPLCGVFFWEMLHISIINYARALRIDFMTFVFVTCQKPHGLRNVSELCWHVLPALSAPWLAGKVVATSVADLRWKLPPGHAFVSFVLFF